ncbi:MAG: outer membrane protein assembly factor BamD [Syntrophobacteraceae bacterium]
MAVLLLCGSLAALGGCAGINLEKVDFAKIFQKKKSPTVDKTAEQLMQMGTQNLAKSYFSDAADDFKKLKEEYPYSKYATIAGLKLGDAYFGEQKYVESAMSYTEFARLHPNNEHAPYVLYQAGMSHFLMFSATDRDLAETAKAMKVFNTVIDNYPDSKYAAMAKKQLFECTKRLACHLYCIGKQYFISGHYSAARKRLETLKQKYPEEIVKLGFSPKVEEMLAKCGTEIAKGPEKPDIWVRMGF